MQKRYHHPKVMIILLFVNFIGCLCYWSSKRVLPEGGGLFFPWHQEISLERMAQADPRWANQLLGNNNNHETIASSGCALSCAAMILHFYGADIDPARLNDFLNQHDGYVGDAWLKWEVAARYPPGGVDHIYEDTPSYALIDWNLLRDNPVIVRVHRPTGKTHFLLIVGKEGWEYLLLDPAKAGAKGPYPATQLGLPFDGLRCYAPSIY